MTKKCLQCGAEFSNEANFCPKCGTSCRENNAPYDCGPSCDHAEEMLGYQPVQIKKKKPIAVLIIAIVLLVALVGAGVWYAITKITQTPLDKLALSMTKLEMYENTTEMDADFEIAPTDDYSVIGTLDGVFSAKENEGVKCDIKFDVEVPIYNYDYSGGIAVDVDIDGDVWYITIGVADEGDINAYTGTLQIDEDIDDLESLIEMVFDNLDLSDVFYKDEFVEQTVAALKYLNSKKAFSSGGIWDYNKKGNTYTVSAEIGDIVDLFVDYWSEAVKDKYSDEWQDLLEAADAEELDNATLELEYSIKNGKLEYLTVSLFIVVDGESGTVTMDIYVEDNKLSSMRMKCYAITDGSERKLYDYNIRYSEGYSDEVVFDADMRDAMKYAEDIGDIGEAMGIY